MTTDELKTSLRELLGDSDYLKVAIAPGQRRGFELSYGSMYSAPQLSFATLKSLSDLFGTNAIDVDNYSTGGCESCDYGSDYGHTIQIYEPTKHYDVMLALVGKDIGS